MRHSVLRTATQVFLFCIAIASLAVAQATRIVEQTLVQSGAAPLIDNPISLQPPLAFGKTNTYLSDARTLPTFSSSRPPQAPPPPPPAAPAANAGDLGNSCDGDDEKLYTDCRGVFSANFYLGLAIDTFAGSDELSLLYRNPGTSGGKKERGIGGLDFSYRLLGDKTPMVGDHTQPTWSHPSLWVYGETLHGVRSADVNCKDNPNLPVCQNSLAEATDPSTQIYYILRNASSLEGYMGLRYEFLTLQPDSVSPANLYIKAQAGFLSLAGAPGSSLAMHHLAFGAVATKGRFQDSYLEMGWGRSDVFANAQHNRLKIDGYLQWKIPQVTDHAGLSAFAQLTVDTHFHHFRGGSDAIQTYIGINYDLDKFFGSLKKN